MDLQFKNRLDQLQKAHFELMSIENRKSGLGNGIFDRYDHPVLTAAHTPLNWRYDLDPKTNPYLMERFGINATFNAGAIFYQGKFLLVTRVEGSDRKSFFAIAESENGIDNFKFWDYPIEIPETEEPDTNIYDMRLVQHQDGWIYGLFCTERKDKSAAPGDHAAAIAQCGIVRTKDLKDWYRLPDLKTRSAQQRNVVLHPEFVEGKYAFYTRPQDSFIEAGNGGGIGFALCDDIEHPVVKNEKVIDHRAYHTIYEAKNGLGPSPIKTGKGWLHLAHGVRNTAAGLRYVLYLFMTNLEDISKIVHKPAGYFMAPEGLERIGDVSNVLFSNGWINNGNDVYIYYASSDTRMHVATSTIDKLVDYVVNTPEDGFRSTESVRTISRLISKNKNLEFSMSDSPGNLI